MADKRKRVSQGDTTIIIADPPWPHANGSRTNSGKSPKYPLMLMTEIKALSTTVQGLAGENAVIYMWVTGPHLTGGIDVLQTWGFNYRSFHIWKKTRVACGFWARSDAEIVLIGEKGRPAAPDYKFLGRTVFQSPPLETRHSSKPTFLHTSVEQLWPQAKKIELFARTERKGWETLGAETGYWLSDHGVLKISQNLSVQ